MKRFSITLPDIINSDLERWANIKGQPKAGICAYLIEQGVERAKDNGELPRISDEVQDITTVRQQVKVRAEEGCCTEESV